LVIRFGVALLTATLGCAHVKTAGAPRSEPLRAEYSFPTGLPRGTGAIRREKCGAARRGGWTVVSTEFDYSFVPLNGA